MSNLNKVIENGRLTKDPEIKMTTSGVSVLRFSIAVENYKGDAQFFDCKAWRETAEFIARNFRKGDGILIEGHLENSTFDARAQGVTYQKTVTEIVVDAATFAAGTKSRVGEGNYINRGDIAPHSASFTAREAANNFKPEEKEETAFTFEEVQDENLPF